MKRILLIALAFVVSLYAIPAPSVYASSFYDDYHFWTDTIDLHDSTTCDQIPDYSSSWKDAFNAVSMFGTVSSTNFNTYKSSLNSALTSGNYAVSQWVSDQAHTSSDRIIVTWTEAIGIGHNTFTGSQVGYRGIQITNIGGTNTYQAELMREKAMNSGGSCDLKVWSVSTGASTLVAKESANNGNPQNPNRQGTHLLMSNYTTEYPSGYNGREINTQPPENSKYPVINYYVQDRKIHATFAGQPSCIQRLTWTVAHTTGGATFVDNATQYQLANQAYDYEVKDKGDYTLIADPTVHAPFIDSCANAGFNIVSMAVTIHIDGTSFSGSNSDMTCTVGAFGASCVPKQIYEDCSTYGADLIGGMGCQFRNFGTFLKVTLIALFIPSQAEISFQFETIQNDFKDQFGFVTSFFDFITQFWNGITNASIADGEVLHFAGTFFGSPFVLDLTTMQTNFPTMWGVVVNVIRGTTIITILFGIYRRYRKILESRA